jgi:hypothetical protein
MPSSFRQRIFRRLPFTPSGCRFRSFTNWHPNFRKYFLRGVRPWLCVRTRLPQERAPNKKQIPIHCAYLLVPPESTPHFSVLIRPASKQSSCSFVRPLLQRALVGLSRRFLSPSPAAPRALAPCAAHLHGSHLHARRGFSSVRPFPSARPSVCSVVPFPPSPAAPRALAPCWKV